MRHRSGLAILTTCLLACGGCSATETRRSGVTTDASSATGCQQQLNDGGLSIAQCTCAAMTASVQSGYTVLAVYSTTSDGINPNYDLGLPAGTPVCFVAESGEFQVSPPPGGSATANPYGFTIYTESPWTVVESGSRSTIPMPGSD